RLDLVDRRGLQLAGPSGNHVDAGGRRPPRAVCREHGRARAEDARSAARPAADPQLVARHEGISRGAAERLRLLAAAAPAAVLARGALAEPLPPPAGAAAMDARHRLLQADRLDLPADAARARRHPRPRSAVDDLLLHRRPG